MYYAHDAMTSVWARKMARRYLRLAKGDQLVPCANAAALFQFHQIQAQCKLTHPHLYRVFEHADGTESLTRVW